MRSRSTRRARCASSARCRPSSTPRTTRNLWLATDAAFHEVLYAPSGRTKTLEMIAVLRASVTRLYRAHLSPNTRRKGWRDEHHALLKAVAAGNVERAVAALTRHLRETETVAVAAVSADVAVAHTHRSGA